MADALDSKSSVRKDVRVQVPPPVFHKSFSDKDFRRQLFSHTDTQFAGSEPISQDFTRTAPLKMQEVTQSRINEESQNRVELWHVS